MNQSSPIPHYVRPELIRAGSLEEMTQGLLETILEDLEHRPAKHRNPSHGCFS